MLKITLHFFFVLFNARLEKVARDFRAQGKVELILLTWKDHADLIACGAWQPRNNKSETKGNFEPQTKKYKKRERERGEVRIWG